MPKAPKIGQNRKLKIRKFVATAFVVLVACALIAASPSEPAPARIDAPEWSLPVVQPEGYLHVPDRAGVVTRWDATRAYGNTAIIAHNYLAGQHFYTLRHGDTVTVTDHAGTQTTYVVTEIHVWRALEPLNPATDFVSLTTGEHVTRGEVFATAFDRDDTLTFYTCLQVAGHPSGGRYVVIAHRQ